MTGNGPMKYNLPVLERTDFERLETFVAACFDQGQQRFTAQVKTVSNQWEDHPKYSHGFLKGRKSLGLAMQGPGDKTGEFHLWMHPHWHTATQPFHSTLLHELVHGFTGIQYGHSAHWRRWLYRVRWHANEARMTPLHIKDLRMHCFNIGLTYNKSDTSKEMDLLVEAFHTAEKEHERVLKNYWERLSA